MKRLLVPVAVLLLVACGGSGGKRKAGASPDSAAKKPPAEALACHLVSVDEVRKITSLDLKAGAPIADFMGYSRCDYDKAAGGTAIFLVYNTEGKYETYSTVPGAVPVAGLGEAAVWNADTHQLGVKVAKGTVSVNFPAEPMKREWAEQIARTALGRL